ncbi:MAG: hypothetical protein GYB31_08300 [Bacteroidetes bacterium]|nr:hypothetical protein [Bacteroidota bacterium]
MEDILDNQEVEIRAKASTGQLMSIGVFFYLISSGFLYLVDFIVRDYQISGNVDYETSFWVIEILNTFLVLVIAWIFAWRMKKLKLSGKKARRVLGILIVLFFLVQILQFVYVLFFRELFTFQEEYLDKLESYNNQRTEHLPLETVSAMFDYLKYAIITGCLIWKLKD